MKGTLALWYEPALPRSEDRGPVRVELHLNLWRDLPSGVNFLDIGLLLEDVEDMSRFYLYVPARLERTQIDDLYGILRSTADAVFNDVVELGAEGDDRYGITRSGRADTVFRIREEDLELFHDEDAVFGTGTRITFREGLVERMRAAAGSKYLRFRIHLTGAARNTFSSEVLARDKVFVSSSGVLEVTEFRLNERRSFPASIARRKDPGRFLVTRIHYFLIRDLEHQLISQHARFEKIRRMEAELWLKYLASAYPDGEDGLTTELAERLVIYHWKERAKKQAGNDEPDGIGDFVAFASFRRSTSSLPAYAVMIVLLGAAGSLLAAAGTKVLASWLSDPNVAGRGAADLEPTAEVRLLIALAVIVALVVFAPAIRSGALASGAAVRNRFRRSRLRNRLLKLIKKR